MRCDLNQHKNKGDAWKAPTTRIHVGAVTPQRPIVVGRQTEPLGPRGITYRLDLAAGTVFCPKPAG